MRQIRNYVGGRFVDGVGTFADVDPPTGVAVAEVHEAGKVIVDDAVAAASAAHDGPWGRRTVHERCDLLRRSADLVDTRAGDLVRAEVADTGKPEPVPRGPRRRTGRRSAPAAESRRWPTRRTAGGGCGRRSGPAAPTPTA